MQDQLHVLQQKYDELNSKFDKVVKQYKEYKQRQDRKHILKEQLDHILECLRNDKLTNEMYHKLMKTVVPVNKVNDSGHLTFDDLFHIQGK